jgi:hypothetical protein
MLPRLGELFPDAIEIISKPRHEYQTIAYAELVLPKAPAIMVGNEIITEGKDIDDSVLEKAIGCLLERPATGSAPQDGADPVAQTITQQ